MPLQGHAGNMNIHQFSISAPFFVSCLPHTIIIVNFLLWAESDYEELPVVLQFSRCRELQGLWLACLQGVRADNYRHCRALQLSLSARCRLNCIF